MRHHFVNQHRKVSLLEPSTHQSTGIYSLPVLLGRLGVYSQDGLILLLCGPAVCRLPSRIPLSEFRPSSATPDFMSDEMLRFTSRLHGILADRICQSPSKSQAGQFHLLWLQAHKPEQRPIPLSAYHRLQQCEYSGFVRIPSSRLYIVLHL